MSVGQVVEVLRRVAQAVGVVDPQPVDEPLVEPARISACDCVEPLGVLDPDRDQGVDREEAAVVEVVVGAPPADQLVVLARVHLVRVLVGAELGRSRAPAGTGGRGSAARRRAPAGCGSRRPVDLVEVVVADHRDAHAGRRRAPSRCRTPRRTATPAPWVSTCHHHSFSHGPAMPTWLGTMSTSTPMPSRGASLGQRGQPAGPAAGRVDRAVVGDVVPVAAAGLRGEQRGEVDPVDAELVQVGQRARGLQQVEAPR